MSLDLECKMTKENKQIRRVKPIYVEVIKERNHSSSCLARCRRHYISGKACLETTFSYRLSLSPRNRLYQTSGENGGVLPPLSQELLALLQLSLEIVIPDPIETMVDILLELLWVISDAGMLHFP